MTRLSCHRFRSNEVRLWLSVIAYIYWYLLPCLELDFTGPDPRARRGWIGTINYTERLPKWSLCTHSAVKPSNGSAPPHRPLLRHLTTTDRSTKSRKQIQRNSPNGGAWVYSSCWQGYQN